jgi:hypothetical protein
MKARGKQSVKKKISKCIQMAEEAKPTDQRKLEEIRRNLEQNLTALKKAIRELTENLSSNEVLELVVT